MGDNLQLILYEFLGCWFHSYPNCEMSGGKSPDPVRYGKPVEKMKFFEQLNYKIVYEWKCDFREVIKTHPELRRLQSDFKPIFLQSQPFSVMEECILNAVTNDQLFAFMLCSAQMPTHLFTILQDFPPFFTNNLINYEDIGELNYL